MTAVGSWAEVGDRVRQARFAHHLSQADLAARLGVDRSALARIESGERQVSALELYRLSEILDVPIGHFVSRPPAAVVSRGQALTDDADRVTRARFRMDAALEAHARDAEWLVSRGFLAPSELATPGPSAFGRADIAGNPRAAARALRAALGLGMAPIASLADACGRAGLHVLVVPGLEAGASLLLDPGLGVAVVGGEDRPGRRRLTAAHELGHLVLQDEYTTDIGVAAGRDEREQQIDVFASEFLLPRDALRQEWESQQASTRHRMVRIAGRYRVSWSVAVRSAREAGVLDSPQVVEICSMTPQRGELLEVLGREPPEDLTAGETSGIWRQAVLAAWHDGAVVASRAVELLHGVIAETDLPEREVPEQA